MALSKVSIHAVQALDNGLNTFSSQSDATLSSFRERAMSLVAEMEAKLAQLADILAQKEAALNRCELRRSHDEDVSCAAEEAAYERARARHDHMQSLVAQAQAAIEAFDAQAADFRSQQTHLTSQGIQYLTHIAGIIDEYVGDGGAATAGVQTGSGGQAGTGGNPQHPAEGSAASIAGGGRPMAAGAPAAGTGDTAAEPESAINISGGDQIASVSSLGGPSTPITIDVDTPSPSLAQLPPVTPVQHDTLTKAAAGIAAALAAGGLIVGGSKMLVREKTDQLFEQQYGITPNELMLKSRGKSNPHIDAYNAIYRDLSHEVVEVQKQELHKDADQIRAFLERDKKLDQDTRSLWWVEQVHDKKVQLQNDEIKLQCFEDGQRRPLVPSGKTRIGGLSEDGLHYVMDRMTSKERFITASTLIAASGMSLSGDDGTSYYFSDGGDNFLRVAHDGSVVEHQVRDTRTGFSTEEPSFKLPGIKTEGFATKPTESSIDMPGIEGGIKYQDPGLRYASKVYHINDDGSGWTASNETKIGGEANLGFSVDPSGASIGVDASVAQVGAKVTDFPAPERIGGAYRQKETGISGGISLSASASVGTSKGFDGSTEYGVKVPFAKIGMVLEGRVLPESYYPQTIRDRLK